MASEDDDEGGTDRRNCTLSLVTVARLKRLAKVGTYGTSIPRVMTNLIELGIREAIDKGHIKLDDE